LEFPNLSWFLEFARMGIAMVDEGAPARLSNLVVESGLLAGLMPLSWRTLSAS
jgi:hypothetical protein